MHSRFSQLQLRRAFYNVRKCPCGVKCHGCIECHDTGCNFHIFPSNSIPLKIASAARCKLGVTLSFDTSRVARCVLLCNESCGVSCLEFRPLLQVVLRRVYCCMAAILDCWYVGGTTSYHECCGVMATTKRASQLHGHNLALHKCFRLVPLCAANENSFVRTILTVFRVPWCVPVSPGLKWSVRNASQACRECVSETLVAIVTVCHPKHTWLFPHIEFWHHVVAVISMHTDACSTHAQSLYVFKGCFWNCEVASTCINIGISGV
uniref:Uncharacterized protein n=1 Tax=Rhipicephalus zambeziensis TaxID=60191 RepID=A0A224YFR3_9ACAR